MNNESSLLLYCIYYAFVLIILARREENSVAEPKLFNFGSNSGSTFFFILAPAPALYCHCKKWGKNWFDNTKTTEVIS